MAAHLRSNVFFFTMLVACQRGVQLSQCGDRPSRHPGTDHGWWCYARTRRNCATSALNLPQPQHFRERIVLPSMTPAACTQQAGEWLVVIPSEPGTSKTCSWTASPIAARLLAKRAGQWRPMRQPVPSLAEAQADAQIACPVC